MPWIWVFVEQLWNVFDVESGVDMIRRISVVRWTARTSACSIYCGVCEKLISRGTRDIHRIMTDLLMIVLLRAFHELATFEVLRLHAFATPRDLTNVFGLLLQSSVARFHDRYVPILPYGRMIICNICFEEPVEGDGVYSSSVFVSNCGIISLSAEIGLQRMYSGSSESKYAIDH